MATAPAPTACMKLGIAFKSPGDPCDVISVVPTVLKIVYNPNDEGEKSPFNVLESHLRRYISEMENDDVRPRPAQYSRMIFPLGAVTDGLCLRVNSEKAFRHCQALHRRITPTEEPMFIIAIFNGIVE